MGGARYTIDGRHRSKSFRTRIETDRFRGWLLQDDRRFDETTGEQESWQTPLADLRVHEWTRRWLGEQWAEWQPRTRHRRLVSFVAGKVICHRSALDVITGALAALANVVFAWAAPTERR